MLTAVEVQNNMIAFAAEKPHVLQHNCTAQQQVEAANAAFLSGIC